MGDGALRVHSCDRAGPWGGVGDALAEGDKDKSLVVCCHSCAASQRRGLVEPEVGSGAECGEAPLVVP
jgi:hypothetical protein